MEMQTYILPNIRIHNPLPPLAPRGEIKLCVIKDDLLEERGSGKKNHFVLSVTLKYSSFAIMPLPKWAEPPLMIITNGTSRC